MTLSIIGIVPLYMLLWNEVYALQKHFRKDHVHMRLWTRLYNMRTTEGSFHEMEWDAVVAVTGSML